MPTLAEIGNIRGHSTAETRWAKFGPYYAMFPIDFAFKVIDKYSKVGQHIIDPFAGRFSSIYAGGVLGRHSVGIEISPVGWLYGKTKLNPAPKEKVINRLTEIYHQRNHFAEQTENMNEFFQLCYCKEVLRFLLSVRTNLDWQHNDVDRTLMAIILVCLHGKLGEGLSNQMRQTKAMGLNYSINWWKKNDFNIPPEINPLDFIKKKIEWRYLKKIPNIKANCQAIYGDSTSKLKEIINRSNQQNIKYNLLFTSPPYYGVVDYHTDQWIRLWLLGEDTKPVLNRDKYKNRFNSKEEYSELLNKVFGDCAKIMHENCTVFVRTDFRQFTLETTLTVLKNFFPNHQVCQEESVIDITRRNQSELFNNPSKKKEVDIILKSL